MTERLKKQIVDVQTGEEIIVDYTDEEMAQWELDRAAILEREAAREAEAQAKAEAKVSALAKLAALGLTEEEAAAIAGA